MFHIALAKQSQTQMRKPKYFQTVSETGEADSPNNRFRKKTVHFFCTEIEPKFEGWLHGIQISFCSLDTILDTSGKKELQLRAAPIKLSFEHVCDY